MNAIVELANKAGVSRQTVYSRYKELGRLPTVEECKARKSGRKEKTKNDYK